MPSWQMRLVARYMRLCVRRSDWGAGAVLARRARRHFGAPPMLQRLAGRGLHHTVVTHHDVRGEWLSVPHPRAGVILYVHGGGYVSCSAATHRPVTAHLARLLRCRVFSMDYRIAPEAERAQIFGEVAWSIFGTKR